MHRLDKQGCFDDIIEVDINCNLFINSVLSRVLSIPRQFILTAYTNFFLEK